MKKLLVAVFVLSLPTFVLAVGGNYPMAGCGLGYLLFGKENPESNMMQVTAFTTNSTFASQWFGITSGTSGCVEEGAQVSISKDTERFVEVNFESLKKEIAAGEGEYVQTLASLLGAPQIKQSTLVRYFKQQYASLIPSSSTTFADLLRNIQKELSAHPELVA